MRGSRLISAAPTPLEDDELEDDELDDELDDALPELDDELLEVRPVLEDELLELLPELELLLEELLEARLSPPQAPRVQQSNKIPYRLTARFIKSSHYSSCGVVKAGGPKHIYWSDILSLMVTMNLELLVIFRL